MQVQIKVAQYSDFIDMMDSLDKMPDFMIDAYKDITIAHEKKTIAKVNKDIEAGRKKCQHFIQRVYDKLPEEFNSTELRGVVADIVSLKDSNTIAKRAAAYLHLYRLNDMVESTGDITCTYIKTEPDGVDEK